MLRQLQISRNTTRLQVSVKRAEGIISGFLVRKGDPTICSDLDYLEDQSCLTLATFCLPDSVHRLPFGYYDFVVQSGNCECARFPVVIPKCLVTEPSTCECPTPVECIEPRDCAMPAEECQAEKQTSVCDIFKTDCGNKIEEKSLDLDWKITAR